MQRTTLTIILGCGAVLAGAFHSQAQQLTLLGDTYTDSSAAAHGSSATINIGGSLGAEGLLQFDITTLPAGTTAANVAKAVLFIYADTVSAVGNITVNEAFAPWAEASATVPPAKGAAAGAADIASAGFVAIDVTKAVEDWLNGTLNYGLILSSGPSPNAQIVIDSRESTTTSHAAVLMVSLQGPAGVLGETGPQGLQGPVGPQGIQGPQGSAGVVVYTNIPSSTTATFKSGSNPTAVNETLARAAEATQAYWFSLSSDCIVAGPPAGSRDAVSTCDDTKITQAGYITSMTITVNETNLSQPGTANLLIGQAVEPQSCSFTSASPYCTITFNPRLAVAAGNEIEVQVTFGPGTVIPPPPPVVGGTVLRHTATGKVDLDTIASFTVSASAVETIPVAPISLPSPHLVAGSTAFVNATTSVVSLGSGTFTVANSYFCDVTDATRTGSTFSVTNNSASQFTITANGTNSDTVNFICVGQ
jgi:hypothetical protein